MENDRAVCFFLNYLLQYACNFVLLSLLLFGSKDLEGVFVFCIRTGSVFFVWVCGSGKRCHSCDPQGVSLNVLTVCYMGTLSLCGDYIQKAARHSADFTVVGHDSLLHFPICYDYSTLNENAVCRGKGGGGGHQGSDPFV